ncbi:MAG: NifB/NifX family molybdenum-iron cluster-binding protein, partial [Bacteroidota bacterium]
MRIAVASNDGWGITGPLGHALHFLIYELQGTTLRRIGFRPLQATGPCPCQSAELSQLLKDCQVVMAGGMSQTLFDQLIGQGIRPVVTP